MDLFLKCFNHAVSSAIGHDEEGEVLGSRQPPEDPQRLPEEDQDSEGSAR